MIHNFKNKLVNALGLLVICILLCFSCDDATDLRETYNEYIPKDVVSLATPDSVAVLSTGYNKLLFRVFVNADPKVKKVVIALFDDDITDADDKVVTTIDINRTIYQPEIYEVEVDMPEGGNEFFVHMEDIAGNESVKYDVFGTSLGEAYVASLEARAYTEVRAYSETEAVFYWESNRTTITVDGQDEEIVVDDLLVESTITYTSDVDGSVLTIVVDESEDITIIPDFISEGTFSYTTTYRLSTDSDVTFDSVATEGTFPVKI